MDPISEIVATVEQAAPESTGALSGEAESTTTTTPISDSLESSSGEGEKAAHREGVVTRKPGETRGRKSNAQRMEEERQAIQRTLQEQMEAEKKRIQAELEEERKKLHDYAITGRQIADGFIYSNVVFLGREFDYFPPIKDEAGNVVKDERQEFYKVAMDMAQQYGWRKLPPWIQIAFVLSSYYGIRMAMPPVRQRFGGYLRGAFQWMGKKFSQWFKRGGNGMNTSTPPADYTGH